jgi:BirA family biotin operon repressor/biotin-[acetyl-CoA-carboxylase] ligase
MRIVRFDSLESTNKYCEALDLTQVEDFTCYWALVQTAGIGQRGNHWEAAPGKNLTFSLVLHPAFLPADRQFRLTQTLSLALCDLLETFPPVPSQGGDEKSARPLLGEGCPKGRVGATIKWPNDIYVGGKKICGTLVSTRLQGTAIASAVCGIGLNVNQTEFPDWVPNPTSLSLLTGQTFELEPLLQQLLYCIEGRYRGLKEGHDPEPEYLEHLMNLGVEADYYVSEGAQVLPTTHYPLPTKIRATITGVDPHGRLLLTAADGRRLSCGMKEISFLL